MFKVSVWVGVGIDAIGRALYGVYYKDFQALNPHGHQPDGSAAMYIELSPTRRAPFLATYFTALVSHHSNTARDIAQATGHSISCQLPYGLACRPTPILIAARPLAEAFRTENFDLRVQVGARAGRAALLDCAC